MTPAPVDRGVAAPVFADPGRPTCLRMLSSEYPDGTLMFEAPFGERMGVFEFFGYMIFFGFCVLSMLGCSYFICDVLVWMFTE